MSVVTARLSRRTAVALAGLAAAGAATAVVYDDARGAASQPACKQYDSVTFGSSGGAPSMPPLIPASLGLMKKYCIKLVETPITSPAIGTAQVTAGRLNIALLAPTALVSGAKQGLKLVAIAPNTASNGDTPFYVAKDSPITTDPSTWKQFEGKRVQSALVGSSTDIAMRIALYRKGVDINKIEFITTPPAALLQQVQRGSVAGGQVGEPNAYRGRKAGQIKSILPSPPETAWGKHAPSSFMVASSDWVNANKDLVTRFQKAYLEAAMRVQRNPEILRTQLRYLLKLTPQEARGINITWLATDYNIDSVIRQVKSALQFKAIPEGMTDAEIRKLFVPMPPLSSLPKLKPLPKKK